MKPSSKEIAELINQIKREKIPVIFGSKMFSSPVMEQIAKETGIKYVNKLRDDDLPGKNFAKRTLLFGINGG